MKVTLKKILSMRPCPEYTSKRMLQLSGGRREIFAEEILGFNIDHEDKIWVACRLISISDINSFTLDCARRSLKYAAESGLVSKASKAARAAKAIAAAEAAKVAARAAKAIAAAEAAKVAARAAKRASEAAVRVEASTPGRTASEKEAARGREKLVREAVCAATAAVRSFEWSAAMFDAWAYGKARTAKKKERAAQLKWLRQYLNKD